MGKEIISKYISFLFRPSPINKQWPLPYAIYDSTASKKVDDAVSIPLWFSSMISESTWHSWSLVCVANRTFGDTRRISEIVGSLAGDRLRATTLWGPHSLLTGECLILFRCRCLGVFSVLCDEPLCIRAETKIWCLLSFKGNEGATIGQLQEAV